MKFHRLPFPEQKIIVLMNQQDIHCDQDQIKTITTQPKIIIKGILQKQPNNMGTELNSGHLPNLPSLSLNISLHTQLLRGLNLPPHFSENKTSITEFSRQNQHIALRFMPLAINVSGGTSGSNTPTVAGQSVECQLQMIMANTHSCIGEVEQQSVHLTKPHQFFLQMLFKSVNQLINHFLIKIMFNHWQIWDLPAPMSVLGSAASQDTGVERIIEAQDRHKDRQNSSAGQATFLEKWNR